MRKFLTRDEIAQAIAQRKKKLEELDVPEWDGAVRLRRLSVKDLKELGYFEGVDEADFPSKLMSASLSDDAGKPLFTTDDIALLAEADFPATVRVFEAAARFNGLSNSDIEKAAAAFGEAQSGDSSTS